jgi:arsenate reductase
MAEGWLRHLYGDRYDALSAGTQPTAVHPLTVRVMAEVGIDISGQASKSVDLFHDLPIHWAITLCDQARETCPYFPYAEDIFHAGFADPAAVQGSEDEKMAAFRFARDEIRRWIEAAFSGDDAGEIRR